MKYHAGEAIHFLHLRSPAISKDHHDVLGTHFPDLSHHVPVYCVSSDWLQRLYHTKVRPPGTSLGGKKRVKL